MSERETWIVKAEALQREAWRIFSSAAPPRVRDTFGVDCVADGGELYQAARDVPGFPFNKVFSFGLDKPVTADRAQAASSWIRDRCAPGSMVAVPPSCHAADAERLLLQQGFARHPLDVSILALRDHTRLEPTRPSNVSVRAVSPDEADLFGRTTCEGFGVTPAAAAWLAALVGRPGMTAYLAFEGRTAIASASMFVSGGWAWLFIGSTRPAFRNRGAQTALLSRRIRDGGAAGVGTFTVAAFKPAEGHDASAFASYRNIRRMGFKIGYDRPNYVAAAP